jgi:hypothetical protein
MTYSPLQADGAINHIHSVAICNEIGARLRSRLDEKVVEMPAHLRLLMKRLQAEPDSIESDPRA